MMNDQTPISREDLADDHALLMSATKEAGTMVSRHFGGSYESWMKKQGGPVSEVDLASDALLKDRLMAGRPDYGWLSEESAESKGRKEAGRLWVIDPIDGTRAFIEGRPEYSVSAALLVDGVPVSGCVYNPETGEIFDGLKGGGARCNGETIHVTDIVTIAKARILVSRSEFRNLSSRSVLAECEVSSISSIAYKLALVAAGKTDATLTVLPKSDWDIAAAHIIIAEAGGIMTMSDGRELTYNQERPRHPNVLAANRILHEELVNRLAQL